MLISTHSKAQNQVKNYNLFIDTFSINKMINNNNKCKRRKKRRVGRKNLCLRSLPSWVIVLASPSPRFVDEEDEPGEELVDVLGANCDVVNLVV